MLTQESLTTSSLNDELREFAEDAQVTYDYPTYDEVVTAIKPYFPELVKQSENFTQLLESVGIVVVQKLWPKLVLSWSVADNKEEALKQVEKYSQPSYSQIRKSLNIDYHWIIKVRPNFWSYDTNELNERYGSFIELEHRPEAWIADLDYDFDD